MEGRGRSTGPGLNSRGHTSFQPAPPSNPPGEQGMEYPRPAPWDCSGCVTWDQSSPSLTSVAERTLMAVPAPGQQGRESEGCDPPHCHTGDQERGSYPREIHVPSTDTEATTTRQVGTANTEAQRDRRLPQCTQWLSHTRCSCLVPGLLAQTPLASPPTSSCPSLFHLDQIHGARGPVLPAVFGTTSAFSCGERRGTREHEGTSSPPKLHRGQGD